MILRKNIKNLISKEFTRRRKKMRRTGFGLKDGSQRGWKRGGRGRNRTKVCRHKKRR